MNDRLIECQKKEKEKSILGTGNNMCQESVTEGRRLTRRSKICRCQDHASWGNPVSGIVFLFQELWKLLTGERGGGSITRFYFENVN